MTFRVGMKVAFIGGPTSFDRSFGIDDRWPSCINTDGTYTVRDVDTRAAAYGWPVVLRFEEYREEPHHESGLGMWEPGFPGDCFRPVTDISVFQEILRSASQKVRA